MKCPFCGTTMVKRKVDVDKTWKGRTITFRDVQAEVCLNCGEEAYSGEDIELMDSIIEGTLKEEEYPKLMNLEEVSSFLRVTPQTVYNMLRDGRIRATKVGREWRFPRETILQFMSMKEPTPVMYRSGDLSQPEKNEVNEAASRFQEKPKKGERPAKDE
ncbi:MAG: helix-turn-helix domain-containing protein [Firmicutes bacterium]|nr:helix-turn-helix domain-containing protein [Bacillota bacterium]